MQSFSQCPARLYLAVLGLSIFEFKVLWNVHASLIWTQQFQCLKQSVIWSRSLGGVCQLNGNHDSAKHGSQLKSVHCLYRTRQQKKHGEVFCFSSDWCYTIQVDSLSESLSSSWKPKMLLLGVIKKKKTLNILNALFSISQKGLRSIIY